MDGAQEEVLVSFVAALTHAGFSIASDGSPWRENGNFELGCFWVGLLVLKLCLVCWVC